MRTSIFLILCLSRSLRIYLQCLQDTLLIIVGHPLLHNVSVSSRTSMSLRVSWIVYRNGNHPPVGIYIFYRKSSETLWQFFGNQTTSNNDQHMYQDVHPLDPMSMYDIRIEAINQRETDNRTSAAVTGATRGRITFILSFLWICRCSYHFYIFAVHVQWLISGFIFSDTGIHVDLYQPSPQNVLVQSCRTDLHLTLLIKKYKSNWDFIYAI